MSAIGDIVMERQRQLDVEGFTAEHDDKWVNDELARASAAYALHGSRTNCFPGQWPLSWARGWWKPKNRRYDLIRAAALIVAEIERLDRAATREARE